MSKKSFNPHDCIGALNTAKQALVATERPFKKETLLSSFKGCGLPTNNVFWSAFRNSGLIQEVSKGKFMFTNKEPIFVGKLVNIKAKYQEIKRNYREPIQKVESVEVVHQEEPKQNTNLQAAINLLKENGYLVFAPSRVEYVML